MTTTLIPFHDAHRLLGERWFRSFFDTPAPVATNGTGFAPAADLDRDGDDLVARFDLPGIDPDNDVTVEVEGRKLIVRGARRDTRDEDDNGRRVREIRYGSFRRVVTLPVAASAADISATYDAGVLTVRVAGALAGSTPTRIEITRAA